MSSLLLPVADVTLLQIDYRVVPAPGCRLDIDVQGILKPPSIHDIFIFVAPRPERHYFRPDPVAGFISLPSATQLLKSPASWTQRAPGASSVNNTPLARQTGG